MALSDRDRIELQAYVRKFLEQRLAGITPALLEKTIERVTKATLEGTFTLGNKREVVRGGHAGGGGQVSAGKFLLEIKDYTQKNFPQQEIKPYAGEFKALQQTSNASAIVSNVKLPKPVDESKLKPWTRKLLGAEEHIASTGDTEKLRKVTNQVNSNLEKQGLVRVDGVTYTKKGWDAYLRRVEKALQKQADRAEEKTNLEETAAQQASNFEKNRNKTNAPNQDDILKTGKPTALQADNLSTEVQDALARRDLARMDANLNNKDARVRKRVAKERVDSEIHLDEILDKNKLVETSSGIYTLEDWKKIQAKIKESQPKKETGQLGLDQAPAVSVGGGGGNKIPPQEPPTATAPPPEKPDDSLNKEAERIKNALRSLGDNLEKNKEKTAKAKTTPEDETKRVAEKAQQIADGLAEIFRKSGVEISEATQKMIANMINSGTFNAVSLDESGAYRRPDFPYQQVGDINKLIDQVGVRPSTPQRVSVGSGKVEEIGKAEINAAQKNLDARIELNKKTQHVLQDMTKIADIIRKADPEFFTHETRKLKINEDASTGATVVRASYTSDEGVTKSITAAATKAGDAIATTTNRFASFVDGIKRDVREFTKWSIAIALVYTPLQKLNDLVQKSIENQALLADVIVTLGESQDAANQIFESAADIAAQTGEAISGVLEGYNLALRATGDITDRTQKYATANSLLRDSIILAKLSTLDQATATDTLVAALRQTNTPLDEGQKLLDKWVKVTKIANVDLATLATSFAVVGESASNAGLSIDDLNGLIAVIATAGITSAKETANAVRALISGYSTDSVSKELAKFGIAVKKADGDARTFKSVLSDIREASKAGLISETELQRISQIIGGGNRRQAQVVTTIVNYDDVSRVAAESALANGEAQRALGIELDTVQTSTVKLSNAFTKLAQNVGTDGGLLSGMTALLNLATLLTNVFGTLTKGLGTASTALALLGASRFFIKGKEGALGGILGTANEFINRPISRIRSQFTGATGNISQIGYNEEQQYGVLQDRAFSKGESLIPAFTNVMTVALIAGLRGSKGDWEGAGLVSAAALAAGLLGKSTVWGTIGATIASAFLSFSDRQLALIGKQGFGLPADQKAAAEAPVDNRSALEKLIQEKTGGSNFETKLLLTTKIAIGEGYGLLRKVLGDKTGSAQLNATEIAAAVAASKGATTEEIFKALQQGFQQSGVGFGNIKLPSQIKIEELQKSGKAVDISGISLSDLEKAKQKELRTQYYDPTSGLSSAEFKRRGSSISGLDSTITEWINGISLMGLTANDFGDTISGTTDLVQGFADVVLKGTDEQIQTLNELTSEYRDIIDALTLGTDEFGKALTTEDIDAFNQRAGDIASQMKDIVPTIQKQIAIANTSVPQFSSLPKVTNDIFEQIRAGIPDAVEKFKAAMNPEEIEAWTAEVAKSKKIFSIDEGSIYRRLDGVEAAMFDQTKSLLEQQGKIQTESPPGISNFDIASTQRGELLARYDAILKKAEAAGYTENKSTVIAQFNDDQWLKMTEDQTILQLALQELIDVNKKQLEGIYNLPANGQFFVPFQARLNEPGGAPALGPGVTQEQVDAALAKRELDKALLTEPSSKMTPEIAKRLLVEQGYGGYAPPQAPSTETVIPEYIQKLTDSLPQPDRWAEKWNILSNPFTASQPQPDRWARDFQPPAQIDKLLEWFNQFPGAGSDFGKATPKDTAPDWLKNWFDQFQGVGSNFGKPVPESRAPDWLTQWFSRFAQTNVGTGTGLGGGLFGTNNLFSGQQNAGIAASSPQQQQAVQQKLNLNITSNVQLRLDGRVVANVVKRYLTDSLLKYTTSNGSLSRSVIV